MKQTTIKLVLAFLFILSATFWKAGKTFAQNKKIDSLLNVYQNSPNDTTRITAGLALSRQLLKISKNSEALNYCKEIQKKCEAAIKNNGSATESFYKKNYAATFNLEGNVYYFQSEYQQAISCYSKALKNYEETNDSKGIANAVNNLGLIAYTQGNFTKAYDYYSKAMKIREQINDQTGLASSYNNMALVLEHQGNYSSALEFHYKALALNDKRADKYGISTSLSNIGAVYSNQKNYKKALEYYIKSLPILEEISNTHGLANVYNNLGIIYSEEGKYAEAIKYHQQALKMREQIGDDYGIAFSYTNLGSIYFSQGNYSAALEYNTKALDLRNDIQDSLGISHSLNLMGQCYFKLGQTKKGEEYCKKSLEFAKKTGEKEAMKEADKALSEIYAYTKDFEKAYFYHSAYVTVRDSLLNEDNLKQGVRAEMNYEFAKKEADEKVAQEKRNAETAIHEHRQKLILWGVSAVLGLVLIFAFFVYRSYLRKQKDHAEIVLQKHIIEQKQKEILDSIHYAKRIQKVLLPNDMFIDKTLKKLQNNS